MTILGLSAQQVLTICYFVIAQLQTIQGQQLPSVYGYPINFCGDKTSQVQSAFQDALDWVESKVIDDVQKSRTATQQRDAFLTFFKGTSLSQQVGNVFGRMLEVQDNDNVNSDTFRIYCLRYDSPGDQLKDTYRHLCELNSNTPAAHVHGPHTFNILLCPNFFQFPRFPRLRGDCPTIQGNKLYPNDIVLAKNQLAIIVHELAHAHGINPSPGERENYFIQDTADLHPDDQIRNAQNFAYYATALKAGCIYWPQVDPNDHTDLRRLLDAGVLDYNIDETDEDGEQAENAVAGSLDVFDINTIIPGGGDLPADTPT
ncbi:uncharacterized protein KY384_003431 [Bacidia gigantensis]|uniref:uncharacterized protein n=1 Tax=Bacidia gigantensis TaxID=2732470 RepID=UPI001D0427F1|nr:uncharacterized protein KY384_003431 [Bacidia gigantensis]KAG8531795.1 hypothetical protein KY384_003431 [Bacidia gigantensis]